jgi:hypothetical protein
VRKQIVVDFASALMVSWAMSIAVSPHPRMRTSRQDNWQRYLYFEVRNTSPLMYSIPGMLGMFGSMWRLVQTSMCEHWSTSFCPFWAVCWTVYFHFSLKEFGKLAVDLPPSFK